MNCGCLPGKKRTCSCWKHYYIIHCAFSFKLKMPFVAFCLFVLAPSVYASVAKRFVLGSGFDVCDNVCELSFFLCL